MLRRLCVTVAVIILTTSVAEAQTQKGERGQRQAGQGFGGGGGVAGLLASPEVQKELGVNAEQKGLIEDMVKDLAAQRGGGGGGQNRQDFQNLSQEERQKRFEELQKQS